MPTVYLNYLKHKIPENKNIGQNSMGKSGLLFAYPTILVLHTTAL